VRGLAPDDRPREKLDRLGPAALGDNELLAIVVGMGVRSMSALTVANAVLDASSGLHGLLRMTRDELRRVAGVGAARASQIHAAIELGRRTLVRKPGSKEPIACPRDVAAFLIPQYGSKAVEHFGVVLLDTRHRVLRTVVVSIGTLDSSLVHPREIFREAATASAAALVLFHNHPSGDPSPSRDDLELTRRLVQAGDLMGINVLDHLIVTDTRYCSFKETGRL
jgi:DNA repair protein RadC